MKAEEVGTWAKKRLEEVKTALGVPAPEVSVESKNDYIVVNFLPLTEESTRLMLETFLPECGKVVKKAGGRTSKITPNENGWRIDFAF